MHSSVAMATMTFKFISGVSLLCDYRAIGVWPLRLLWRHSCDVVPFRRWCAVRAVLLRFSSCLPVLVLGGRGLGFFFFFFFFFFQANVFSQITKFFVISVQMTLINLHTVRTLVRLLWERSGLGLNCLSKTVCLDSYELL